MYASYAQLQHDAVRDKEVLSCEKQKVAVSWKVADKSTLGLRTVSDANVPFKKLSGCHPEGFFEG